MLNRPLLMGILNVTPDSFSDGGKYFSKTQAIDQARRLEDEGADIIDIGGESTRPYSQPVSAEDEVCRVAPVLEAIQGKVSVPISIDTTKAIVAQAAIDLGAEIINDISGLTADPEMASIALRSEAGLCVMHMQGTPATMQDAPTYSSVIDEIMDYLRSQDERLRAIGIASTRICLDPGIGFGKTHEHNLTLLQHVAQFHALGRPLLVGHSRKGFIAKILGDKSLDRKYGTIGVSLALATQGVQILRVHDVAPNKQALDLFFASLSNASFFRH